MPECIECGKQHDGRLGSGQFCSVSCSRKIGGRQRWMKKRAMDLEMGLGSGGVAPPNLPKVKVRRTLRKELPTRTRAFPARDAAPPAYEAPTARFAPIELDENVARARAFRYSEREEHIIVETERPLLGGVGSVPARLYEHWRQFHVPLLYDWVSSRKSAWPSECVAWGGAPLDAFVQSPATERAAALGNGADLLSMQETRSLLLAERTADSDDANSLVLVSVRVPSPHVTRVSDVSRRWSESASSLSDLKPVRRIIHPGEVNRARPLPNGLVVTHAGAYINRVFFQSCAVSIVVKC